MSPPSSPGVERLQKILSRAGVASRRAAEDLVRAGRVSVNGEIVTTIGSKADPRRDDVRLDGERLRPERLSYWMLYKPPGILTTLDDPEGRPTVRSLLPPGIERVFPVGRLDFSSAGLLLLTNDGDLAAKLLHPRRGIPRSYRVKVHGSPDERSLGRLRRGIRLADGPTGPAEVEVESRLPTKTWLRITIREGRNREIRRMCEAVGLLVDKLVRVRFGSLLLRGLRPGAIRRLSPAEFEALRVDAGLSGPPRESRGGRRPVRARSSGRSSRRS